MGTGAEAAETLLSISENGWNLEFPVLGGRLPQAGSAAGSGKRGQGCLPLLGWDGQRGMLVIYEVCLT